MIYLVMLLAATVLVVSVIMVSVVALHRLSRPAAAPRLVVRCQGSGWMGGSQVTRYGSRAFCRSCGRGFHVADRVVLTALPEHEKIVARREGRGS